MTNTNARRWEPDMTEGCVDCGAPAGQDCRPGCEAAEVVADHNAAARDHQFDLTPNPPRRGPKPRTCPEHRGPLAECEPVHEERYQSEMAVAEGGYQLPDPPRTPDSDLGSDVNGDLVGDWDDISDAGDPVYAEEAGEPVTWYADGPYTHGVRGFASVSNEGHDNFAGAGPDYAVTATPAQMAAWLRRHGFYQLETDVDELGDVWAATGGDQVVCAKHGLTTYSEEPGDSGSSAGFAGGTIYYARLACGCYDVDESSDVAAAR